MQTLAFIIYIITFISKRIKYLCQGGFSMNNTSSVNILLATYNGEKYIKKQLDSLLSQTYPNITIYIRDDGSKDNTMNILKDYIAKNILLLENGGTNLGCPMSFYQILKECASADYYAFCDQDDIWYPDKIKWAVEKLDKKSQTNKPCVYFSAYEYYTDTGEFLRQSPSQKKHITLTDVLYYTPASGFVLVFNETARQELILNINPGKELHDRWLLRGAACFGNIIYDARCSAAHIRHADAVTAEDSGNYNLIQSFLKNEIGGTAMTDSKEHLKYFQHTFQYRFTKAEQKTLSLFTAPNSLKRQIQKLFYPKRLRARIAGEIAIRILFFIGKI